MRLERHLALTEVDLTVPIRVEQREKRPQLPPPQRLVTLAVAEEAVPRFGRVGGLVRELPRVGVVFVGLGLSRGGLRYGRGLSGRHFNEAGVHHDGGTRVALQRKHEPVASDDRVVRVGLDLGIGLVRLRGRPLHIVLFLERVGRPVRWLR